MHNHTQSPARPATALRRYAENTAAALIWAALTASALAFPAGVYIYTTGQGA